MLDKLRAYKVRFEELQQEIVKPEVIADNRLYKKLTQEYNNITPIVELYEVYNKTTNDIAMAEELVKSEKDSEMVGLLYDEIYENKDKLAKLTEEAKILLLPVDLNDDKNVIMEIRAGAGGEEASLFGMVLFRMYTRFAERNRWRVEVIDMNETELGGVKEASFLIKGTGAYKRLKFESGVHRVQRVPETESSGRIHTSTATVAVLPEQEDVDIEIEEKDLKIDTYRSSGAGGQHVNKTESAIRITHLPTGIVVSCQDERSQIKNRERAMSVLKSKLYDFYQTQADEEYAKNRKTQVGTGDRSERIRTYNYPQGRLTDHRINYTVYNLDAFLDGDINDLIDNLIMADQKAKLEQSSM
ncbi:MAG: peptide chain release factor 1 [Clostridia bacterium]|nr:peptide chain release factor 1 [Clostridia bacterium]